LPVGDNVLLGMEKTRLGFLERSTQERIAREALGKIGHGDLDLSTITGLLPIGVRQAVEIARSLTVGCRVLVLDEPTSSLTHSDTERLFSVLASLKSDGIAIVYISHFFDEINRVSDRFTVLRDGRVTGTGVTSDVPDEQIISMMVGRKIENLYARSSRKIGAPLLQIEGLCGVTKPSGASLEVRRGEVVGIAGLGGSGRTELLRAVFGLDRVRSGIVAVCSFTGRHSPAACWARGAGFLSEDRKAEGLASEMTVAENVTLTKLPAWISPQAESAATKTLIDQLSITTQGPGQPVSQLSGGNQQKVALARLLHHDVDLFLLDEPTRGIDVASKQQMYRLIDQVASDGKAVLMVSSYLPELLGVCDRIAVMSRGRLGEARPASDWSQESLMQEAVGA
ncbi:MAG: sugar ABC transporter ATP-binding protein, partial [Armatimonadetes bacterium]|nr:sugar ABC transporter ATP-binding protein [Armatimonadota bacterium]